MGLRTTILAACLLAAMAAPRTVAAQQSTPSSAEAMRLFEQSAVEYRAGRFAAAAALLRRAYASDPVPILQYNLARALEGLGDLPGAALAYQTYVDRAPDASDRASIEARVATLRRQIAEREALERDRASASSEEARGEPPRRARGPSAVPWIVAGVGVAGIGAGVALGLMASARHSDAEAEPVQARTVALASEADDLALAANLTFAIAGAVAVLGIVWGVVDVMGSGGDAEPSLAIAIAPGGVTVRAQF